MRRLGWTLIAGLTAACAGSTAAPAPDLSGTWMGRLAGGDQFILRISDVAQQIDGTGRIRADTADAGLPLTVVGSHRQPDFALTLISPGFRAAGFSGTVTATELRGTLNGSGFQHDSLVLTRP